MDISEIVGKKLIRTATSYRGGCEYLTLIFQGDDGVQVRVSVRAERGSDLWINVRTAK